MIRMSKTWPLELTTIEDFKPQFLSTNDLKIYTNRKYMDNITIVYLGNLNKSVTHVKHVQKQDFFFF